MRSIPAGWRTETIADLASGGLLVDGDWVESKDQDPQGDVRLVQLADVGVATFRNRSNRHMRVDQADRLNCTYLEPGDLLIARMPEPIGRTCFVPLGLGRAVTAVDVAILRLARHDLEPRFIMWALNSPDIQQQVIHLQAGTTRKRISRKNLAGITVPVPPLAEQKSIVDQLEDELSRLDNAHSLLANCASRVRALVRGVIQEAVPMSRTPNWRMTTVAEAGELMLGRQRHPDWHTGPEMRRYLRVANVFEDRIDTSSVKEMDFSGVYERYRLVPGDILLNEGQSPELLGRPAMYKGDPPDAAFTNTLIRFQASASVLPEWALLVFRRHMHSGRFAKESRITTNIAHLSLARLKTVEFPIPPLAEQRRLIAVTTERLSAIERLHSEIDTARKRETALRRELLRAAFSGRLTPPQHDHTPVEELFHV